MFAVIKHKPGTQVHSCSPLAWQLSIIFNSYPTEAFHYQTVGMDYQMTRYNQSLTLHSHNNLDLSSSKECDGGVGPIQVKLLNFYCRPHETPVSRRSKQPIFFIFPTNLSCLGWAVKPSANTPVAILIKQESSSLLPSHPRSRQKLMASCARNRTLHDFDCC